MEDKTLEMMVRIVSMSYFEGNAEARFDGRNELKRLVGRGGGERRADQQSEGGPEIIDTFS